MSWGSYKTLSAAATLWSLEYNVPERQEGMAQVYIGRCANARCSGGMSASAYPLRHPVDHGIPSEVVKALPDDQQICYCSWCKFVWQQPTAAKLGVEAEALGYVEEEEGGKPMFTENRRVAIRDWKLNVKRVPGKPSTGRGSGGRRNRH